MGEPYRVFVSHGSDDTYIVHRHLQQDIEKSGALVFVDAGALQYGDDFRNIILEELGRCDELLVLLTPSSIRRPWVLAEIGAAVIRGKRVVAVRYGPSEKRLQELGILSLLGNHSLLVLDRFDDYVNQLTLRVKAHN